MGPVGDDSKAHAFGDTRHGAFDRVFRPGSTGTVAEEGTGGILGGELFDDALVSSKDDYVVVDVFGFENAGFLGAAARGPEEVEEVDDWALGSTANLFPLFGGIENVSALGRWLANFGDGVVSEVAFFVGPVECSLHDAHRIVLSRRAPRLFLEPRG